MLKAFGATNVRVFGSITRGEDDESSDVDLLAEMLAGVGLFERVELELDLADLLKRKVDLVIPVAKCRQAREVGSWQKPGPCDAHRR